MIMNIFGLISTILFFLFSTLFSFILGFSLIDSFFDPSTVSGLKVIYSISLPLVVVLNF